MSWDLVELHREVLEIFVEARVRFSAKIYSGETWWAAQHIRKSEYNQSYRQTNAKKVKQYNQEYRFKNSPLPHSSKKYKKMYDRIRYLHRKSLGK